MTRPNPQIRLLPLAALLLLLSACESGERFEVSGLLEWDRIELIAEAGEPIVEILATEGERLQSGQPVLQLDPGRTAAQRDEAEAARTQAAARLAELKRGPRAELIDEAQARLRGAKSALETRQTEYDRVQALIERKLASSEALDLARSARDTAKAERDAANASLAALLTGTTVEELQQADAALQQAEARLRALKITLERMTAKAPQDGLLDVLPYKLGERPRAGDVVAVMLAGQKPYARVYIPEPYRALINHQTETTIHVDGIEQPFTGKVRMVSRDAAFTPFYSLTQRDRSRLSYVAEIELQDQRATELTSGIPLKVEFYTPAAEKE
ncbi:MAG: HlyD family efflux transporter periplasmic adaptor subunit [Gammaproteobacteria bacterium]|nr:HlyD family efflux transporter periplasmic adaptor subunit [Gammaproteobacteria bacterium]